jgi:hypothetical protein
VQRLVAMAIVARLPKSFDSKPLRHARRLKTCIMFSWGAGRRCCAERGDVQVRVVFEMAVTLMGPCTTKSNIEFA